MKTKPITVRFDENHLNVALSMSGLKKTQKLMDFLLSEYVKPLTGVPAEFPKDMVAVKEVSLIDKNGVIKPIQFADTVPPIRPSMRDILTGKKEVVPGEKKKEATVDYMQERRRIKGMA